MYFNNLFEAPAVYLIILTFDLENRNKGNTFRVRVKKLKCPTYVVPKQCGTLYTAVAFVYSGPLRDYYTVRLLTYIPFGAGATKRKSFSTALRRMGYGGMYKFRSHK